LVRVRIAAAVAALALTAGAVTDASAHEVTITGADMDVGIMDYDGFTWTVRLKARVSCSGADRSHVMVTFEQLRTYTRFGGAAVVTSPPANTYEARDVMLPPGLYRVRFASAACESTEPMPDGHEGNHGAAMADPAETRLNLPDCRPRATRFAPLVPVVGRETNMRAQCPARLCDALGSAARVDPLLPVTGGPPVPAPCPTVSVNRAGDVPVDVVCGPGVVSARHAPLVPVRGRPCRGRVELVGVSAGVANSAATRVVGAKRFKIRRGTFKPVRIPLARAALARLRITRVMTVRAVVRAGSSRRKSKPFTVIKRR
jgi:hypothetical protein